MNPDKPDRGTRHHRQQCARPPPALSAARCDAPQDASSAAVPLPEGQGGASTAEPSPALPASFETAPKPLISARHPAF